MYLVAPTLVLHVYGAPDDRLRRSLHERAVIQQESPLPGVPAVRTVHESDGRIWVLEDHVPGLSARVEEVGEWFPRVRDWLVRMAGPPGPPLYTTPFWASHRDEAVQVAPAELRPAVADAWLAIRNVGARTLHGDVQPSNVVLDDGSVGLVDWEGAWRHGLPGLDLVYLAVMSAPRPPDGSVIQALATGGDPPNRRIQEALRELDLIGNLLPAALLAMLATWNLGEVRRLARGGARGQRATTFRSLLLQSAPQLSPRLR